MNQNVLIFKYTLIAFYEIKKSKENSKIKLNENEFFQQFINSLNQNLNFLNSNVLNEDQIILFLNQANTVCEFESLTFMPEDSKEDYKNSKNNLNHFINTINHDLISNHYIFSKNFNDHDWRIFISFVTTFKEWTHDIKFFEIPNNNQYEILKESPLISFCQI